MTLQSQLVVWFIHTEQQNLNVLKTDHASVRKLNCKLE